MRAKPPGCFFVGAIERAAVHPGGHAVELLPHLRVCGDDDVNDDDDDDVVMVMMLTRMRMMFSCSQLSHIGASGETPRVRSCEGMAGTASRAVETVPAD